VPLFILFVPFGYMGEIRVFYEVYPVIFLLIAQSTAIILGSTVNAQDAEISSSYRSS
jgi:hypothetical protein